ncbi:MAG: hypothetical protein EA384_09020 [Spirochaetaceae bacterium]|nr:MAG: hypothetical protein EA384_09020 [Spirochaetaceae bacterium]
MQRVTDDSVLRCAGILVLVFVSVVLIGCGQEPEQPAPAARPAAVVAPVAEAPAAMLEAVIVFTVGDVSVQQDGNWYDAEIGVALEPDAVIHVGAASYCELQLGSLAMVRVDADTALVLASLSQPARPEAAAVHLEHGTVVSKVRRVIGTESFEVRTATVTAGVRGTEFVVTRETPERTVVAVQEGAVVLSPPGVPLTDIQREAQGKSPEVQTAVGQLQTALPIVGAGQQVTVDRQQSDRMRAALDQPASELLQVVRADEPDPRALDELGGQLAAAQQTLDRAVPRETISAQTRARLEPAADLQFRDLPAVPRAQPQPRSGALPPVEPTVSETIAVQPAPAAAALPAAPTTDLPPEPPPPAAQPAPTPAAQPQPPRRAPLSVSVVPADAEISVNGRTVARGSWSEDFEVAGRVTVTAARPGFAPAQQVVTIRSGANELQLRLEPRPVEARFAVSRVAPTGGIAASGNRVVVMDRDGRLAAHDLSGRQAWEVTTNNAAVQSGRPVIADGIVYASGARELVAVDLDSGHILLRHALSAQEANPFGHRPAFADGKLYFNATDKIVVRRASSGEIVREIPLQSSTRMSPAIWGSSLVVADQRGRMLLIDRSSGALSASVPTEAMQPVSQAAAVAGTRAVFAGRRETVAGVDLAAARVLWTRSLGDRPLFEDPVVAGAAVYIRSDDLLFGLRLSDGIPLFEPLSGVSASPVYLDGLLFVGHADGSLLGVDPANASVVGRLRLAGRPVALVGHQGRLLIATQEGEVWVVHPAGMVSSR